VLWREDCGERVCVKAGVVEGKQVNCEGLLFDICVGDH
jgi:hypothetical protein